MLRIQLKRLVPLLGVFTVISGCDRPGSLVGSPPLTPGMMLNAHPHVRITIGSLDFILMEPSSSLLVLLLGLSAAVTGIYFMIIRENQRSRIWWGLSLLLWGTGALLAGTSYQSFGYEIKCAGREYCAWTSWWEIYYLLFSAASINAMMMGVARSSAGTTLRKAMTLYAAGGMTLYSVVCLAGACIPNRFMMSFELMVLFTAPSYILFFIVNTVRYVKVREAMDLRLMTTWLSLGGIMAAYFGYYGLGVTEKLWSRGIWFSENDVLHAGLILWMLYIGLAVARKINDAPDSDWGRANREGGVISSRYHQS